jgi:endonuclease/exonuclease/phosphatase (EEP) superfamily protein YafD
MILKKVLQGVGILAIILTLLPFIAVDYWWIRVFDFPHLQLTLFTFIALLIYFIKFDFRLRWDYIFAVLLLGCFVFQLTKIYPFTFLAPHEVLASTTDNADTNIAIFTANVLQTNKNSSKLTSELEGHRADIVLLTETDGYWLEQVGKDLRSRYP